MSKNPLENSLLAGRQNSLKGPDGSQTMPRLSLKWFEIGLKAISSIEPATLTLTPIQHDQGCQNFKQLKFDF